MGVRLRESLVRLGLVLGSTALVLATAEAAFRLAGYEPARFQAPGELYSPREQVFLDTYPSNPRGYFDIDLRQPAPRRHYEALGVRGIDEVAARAPFAVEVRYNHLLFREREVGPKAPGVRRVVVLGDSFTEGQGVKEADTAVRRLETALNTRQAGWEVLNWGRRGADFPSLHKMFERALLLEPDVVVHAMVLNDAERSPELDRRAGLDDWILERRRLLTGEATRGGGPLRLVDFARDRLEGWRVGRETTRWYLDLYGPANAEGWRRTREAMRDMDRRMRARGGRFLVASWPLLVDLDAYPFEAADETIAAFCTSAGIPRVDLRAALRGRPAADLWVHAVDHHPNETAQRLAAAALVDPVRALAPP